MLLRDAAKARGNNVVFTNGVFDILHVGHLRYLTESKKLGELLIIGVNSDSSARKIKGEGKPINTEADRMELLAGLSCVDMVFAFSEETPTEVIRKIKPDYLVKGSDYAIEDIVGKELP